MNKQEIDNIVNVINTNKELISNSTIIYVGDNIDFFENIISCMTNTIIYSINRKSIPSQFITESLCIFFEKSYDSYGIQNFISWINSYINGYPRDDPKKIPTNFKVLDSSNYSFTVNDIINYQIPEEIIQETIDEVSLSARPRDEISDKYSFLYEPEKLLFNLNKIF